MFSPDTPIRLASSRAYAIVAQVTTRDHILIEPQPLPLGDEPQLAVLLWEQREEERRSTEFLADLLRRRAGDQPAVRVV